MPFREVVLHIFVVILLLSTAYTKKLFTIISKHIPMITIMVKHYGNSPRLYLIMFMSYSAVFLNIASYLLWLMKFSFRGKKTLMHLVNSQLFK